jgi:predicted RNA-binding Zn-ribbon protein involved in translation (DUF1610 family)
MPFIIWGWRGVNKEIDSGAFFCPNCGEECDYRLMQSRPFFTIFFCPVFPVGSAQRYVECAQCGQTYLERVLDMAPPTEEERLIDRLFGELATGSSLETVQRKMEAAGIAPDQAESIVKQGTKGHVWQCDGCGERYLDTVKKCLRCEA